MLTAWCNRKHSPIFPGSGQGSLLALLGVSLEFIHAVLVVADCHCMPDMIPVCLNSYGWQAKEVLNFPAVSRETAMSPLMNVKYLRRAPKRGL